jgi:D-amino-acid dehydrogenase
MTRHVAIIGAGVIGSISAVEALRQGHRVTIIESGEPGGEQSASYGNAAWLSTHSVIPPAAPGIWTQIPVYLSNPLGPLAIRWSYLLKAAPWLLRYVLSGWTEAQVEETARALRPLLADAPSLHKRLATEAGVGDLIEQAGLMHVFPSRRDFEADAMAWELRRSVGVTWTELNAEEMRIRQPDLDHSYGFGLLVEEAGHCRNPGGYVAALVAHARTLGATLVCASATGLRIDGNGRLKGVLTEGGEIACDAAAICAGVYSKKLAAAAGDLLPLETERGYHVTVEDPGVGLRTPVMASDRKVVVTQTGRGLRVAGQVEIAGVHAAPNWRRAEILREHLFEMFPALPRDLPPDRIRYWMGHRPSMPDGRPCIGRATATADVVYAFGHGHIGLVSSVRTGRIVAQLLSEGEPEIPLAPFDPRRFRRSPHLAGERK